MNHGGARRRQSGLLLPTDFQKPSRRAFLHGIKLATALGAQLTLLHVIKTPTDLSHKAPDSRSLRALRTSALLEIGRLIQTAKERGVSAQPLLLYGDPIGCIVETAMRGHTDMIVMGTEGRTGWDRLRIGSTTQGVVCQAPCPVLTVHGGLAGDVFRHPVKVRLRRILLGTDFSSDADSALQVVRGLAPKLKATVRIVHAAQASSDNGHADRTIAKYAQDLRSIGVEADGVCVQGDPVETMLTQAALYQADLLAVGTRGQRGLTRLILGSVAEALIKRAGCPVMTVRNMGVHREQEWR
jgi:nucleotide-binding universal stress UspA family protein